jgi:hypothetical protein
MADAAEKNIDLDVTGKWRASLKSKRRHPGRGAVRGERSGAEGLWFLAFFGGLVCGFGHGMFLR